MCKQFLKIRILSIFINTISVLNILHIFKRISSKEERHHANVKFVCYRGIVLQRIVKFEQTCIELHAYLKLQCHIVWFGWIRGHWVRTLYTHHLFCSVSDVCILCWQGPDLAVWKSMYDEVPELLSQTEKKNWISSLQAVAVSSDAFFPFRDNIDRAKRVNMRHLSQKHGLIFIYRNDPASLDTVSSWNSVQPSLLMFLPFVCVCVCVCRVVFRTLLLLLALLLTRLWLMPVMSRASRWCTPTCGSSTTERLSRCFRELFKLHLQFSIITESAPFSNCTNTWNIPALILL